MPKTTGSIFHTSFHFVCHFSIMVLGGMCYIYKERIKFTTLRKDILLMALSFIAYFAVMAVGKGKTDSLYYTQIACLLPLHTFVYYLYKVASYGWCEKAFAAKGWRWLLIVPATLTLEIYIVQFHIITNKLNILFPLNTVIVFAAICLAAYLLHVLTTLFLQVMGKEDMRWRDLLKIIG